MKRVFVLDDDIRVVELISLVLQRAGFQVDGATSFEEAEQKLSQNRADLLVSDLSMPGVQGIVGIRALHRRGLIRRALVVSGYIDNDAAEAIEEMPEIVGFLEKPFDILHLASTVQRHLDEPSAERAAGE